MKKSHLILGGALLVAVTTFVVYINKKSPATQSGTAQVVADQDQASDGNTDSDNYKSNGFAQDSGSMPEQPQQVPASGDPKTQKLEAFVQAAKVAEEFNFLDEQMDLQYERLKKMAGPEELAAFEELRNQLKGEELLAEYKEVLKEQFSEEELEQLNDLYKTSDFQRYKAVEAHYKTEAGRKDLATHSKTFDPKKLQADRREALTELVKASGAADQMNDMLGNVGNLFGSATGAGQMNKKDTKVYQDMMRKSIEDAMLMSNAKTFEGQPVEAIHDMAKILANPTLRRAEAAKVEYITKKLVKVVEPKLKEAMNKK